MNTPKILSKRWTLIVAAGCLLAMRTTAQVAPGDGLSAIQDRMVQLEDQLHKARALRDIKRLQYSYAHYAELGLWFDLGDLFSTDGVAHYAQGDFRGPESLRKFYLQELGRGQLGLAEGRIYPHIMIQPVVTVAKDGKTARGRWHVIAMLGSYGASASWAGVVYENRYVFEDGVWKISELSYNSQYSGRYSPPGLTVSKWDLPYHFTPQSAADPAAKSDPPAQANGSTSAVNLEGLQQRWVELARTAQQLRDETDVLNLQHSFGYYSDQKMWGAVANLFADDGTMELGLRGVYAGKDRIRRALSTFSGARLGSDEVNDHLQLAAVVHIAPDGRTAKARGIELSIAGLKGKGAQWEEGIFENEYVKQSGIWRIRSVHYYPRVLFDYELGWAKDAKPAPGPSTEFPPDRPSTEVYGPYPKMYYPRFHYANPATRVPVQYPAGIAAIPESSSPAVLPSPPKNLKEFNTRLSDMERQIDSSIAYDAVENLVNADGYFLDDSREENALAIHQTVQPVITLSPDGKSATIRARLLKVGGKSGGLAGGTYEGRAINRAGTWKLEPLTLKQTWASAFNQWAPVVEHRR
jgi:SnoaL-like domain